MSLSQDEINALLTGDPSDDSEPVEIMSPEDIAAMLDNTEGAQAVYEGPDPDDLLSTEDIAAMLDDTAAISEDDDSDLDDLFSRLDEDASDAVSYPSGAPTGIEGDGVQHLPGIEGLLTAEEVDILGEVGNISMGAVATTMYSLLDRRVSITTPRVTVFEAKDVLSMYRIPFVVATIEYVQGISGNNLLVLKVDDAAMITDILMGGDGVIDTPTSLNEMHLSAMSEIMNQMMGASSTSLSKLLMTPINISPPKSSQVDVGFDVTTVLGDSDKVTKISFDMEIEGLLKSELIQLMPYDVSREFAKRFMDAGILAVSPGDGDQSKAGASAPAPAPAPSPAPMAPAAPPPQMQTAVALEPPPAAPMQQGMPYPPAAQYPYQQAPYQADPYQQAPYQYPAPGAYPPQSAPFPTAYPASSRLVDVHPVQFQSFDAQNSQMEQKGIDLVYNIPLQVTVELGKTRKEISEILEFGSGTIVVLDKIAGDPVEIVVNGKLIARGEVVVIDENYGVRITDIING